MVIDLGQLASSMTTRSRGSEAFERLRLHLVESPEHFELDITGDLVSTSFLDELVRNLAKEQALDRVAFRVRGAADLEKLSRIAQMREANVRYIGLDTNVPTSVRPVAPAASIWSAGSKE